VPDKSEFKKDPKIKDILDFIWVLLIFYKTNWKVDRIVKAGMISRTGRIYRTGRAGERKIYKS